MTKKVPFVPTVEPVATRMLELSNLKAGETLCDLGSGDGAILITAARDFGAKALGIEVRQDLVKKSRKEARELGLEKSIKVIQGDFFNICISEADVVTLFLLPRANAELRPKLKKELRADARIVTHDYEIRGWQPIKKEKVELDRTHPIFLYRCGDIRGAGLSQKMMSSLLDIQREHMPRKIWRHEIKLIRKICDIFKA